MQIKQIAAGLAAALFLAGSASALENTVKPEVTAPLAKSPKVALLVGNSYSFYNCGVHTYLRGLMKAGTPKENMKTRLLTISSGSLSFHDMKFYLSPHEQDPYAVVKDGKLEHPMFDIVMMQGHSAAATSKKRLPFFEKYAKQHADSHHDLAKEGQARRHQEARRQYDPHRERSEDDDGSRGSRLYGSDQGEAGP